MTAVGIYVDGPNIERGLFDAGELVILGHIGSILDEYARGLGEVAEAWVFVDEGTQWRIPQTKADYEGRGFSFRESKVFGHLDPQTGHYIQGKSLTDPAMHCAMMDRLHDEDCPDVFLIATGDKDVTVPLEYIREHGRSAVVLGEAGSLSAYLVEKCDSLGFGCHVIQLVARTSPALRGRLPPEPTLAPGGSGELHITDASGRPVSPGKYDQYRNDRANQLNPNNLAYWRSRGFSERPSDWEERAKEESEEERERAPVRYYGP
jgi:hypothetical protein